MNLNEETLNRNLKVLDEVYPEISKKIKEAEPLDWTNVILSENGMPNMLITKGAKTIHCYDMKNPRAEALDAVKPIPFLKKSASVIIGAGLGYLAKAMISLMEKGHHVIVIEPFPYMLKLFLSHYIYEKYLLDGSLILCNSKEDVLYILSLLESTNAVDGWTLLVEKHTAAKSEYAEFIELATGLINQNQANIGTVSSNGYIIASNDISGLPYYLKLRGITELKDLFKGKPAVLVSTGPSLQKNIHILRKYQDKVVIVCVAQALRILLAYDIRPTLAGSVDYGVVNLGHFKGLMSSDVPMVILNRCYYPIFQKYLGPKFVSGSYCGDEYKHRIFGMIDEKGCLPAGGSVSHFIYAIAHFLGCDPIIWTGQDLALTDNKSHFNQADESGIIEIQKDGHIEWSVKDHRSCLVKEKEGKHSMGPTVLVKGYWGGLVPTNSGLKSFITAFDNMITEYNKISEVLGEEKRNYINCTEGGAHIEGTNRATLKETLKRYAINNIDKSVLNPYLTTDPKGDELVKKAIPLLKADIRSLNKIERNSSLGIKTLDLVEKYSNEGNTKELDKALLKNTKYSLAAETESKNNPLIGLAIYKESREIQSRKFSVDNFKKKYLLKEKGKEDLKVRVERNKIILEASKEASIKLRKLYQESLELLEKYNKTKDESLLIDITPEEIDLSDAEEYFERGNFAHPLLDIRKKLYGKFLPPFQKCLKEQDKKDLDIEQKALKIRNDLIKEAIENEEKEDYSKILKYNNLIEQSKEIGKREINNGTFDFTSAIPILEEAQTLFPDKEEVLWGLASSYLNCRRIDDAIKLYNKLIEKYPDKYVYQYELGIVELRDGDIDQGIKRIEDLMKKTDQFNHFLIYIGDIYYEAGLYDKAIDAYSKYSEKFPTDFNGYVKNGKALEKAGKMKEAIKCYKKAKKLRGTEMSKE